jgi:hypothetical protein
LQCGLGEPGADVAEVHQLTGVVMRTYQKRPDPPGAPTFTGLYRAAI